MPMPIVQLARHIGRCMVGCRLRVRVNLVRRDLGPVTRANLFLRQRRWRLLGRLPFWWHRAPAYTVLELKQFSCNRQIG